MHSSNSPLLKIKESKEHGIIIYNRTKPRRNLFNILDKIGRIRICASLIITILILTIFSDIWDTTNDKTDTNTVKLFISEENQTFTSENSGSY